MTTPSASSATTRKFQEAGVAVLAVLGLLGLAACGSGPEEDRDAIAVGEDGSVGSMDLRSFLLVAAEKGQPGRLLGTLDNDANEPMEVTISDADDEATVIVPAGGQFPFDTNETVFTAVGDTPGALTTITATTSEGTTDLRIPVVDGTLERYEPYLPD